MPRPIKKPRADNNVALFIGIAIGVLGLTAVLMIGGSSQKPTEAKTPEQPTKEEAQKELVAEQPKAAKTLPEKTELPKDERAAALAALAEREKAYAAERNAAPKPVYQPPSPERSGQAQSGAQPQQPKPELGTEAPKEPTTPAPAADRAKTGTPMELKQAASALKSEGDTALENGRFDIAKEKYRAANALVPGIAPTTDEEIRKRWQAGQDAHAADMINKANQRPRAPPRTGE